MSWCEYFEIPGIPFLDLNQLKFQKMIDRNRSPISLYSQKLTDTPCVLKQISLTKYSEAEFRSMITIIKLLLSSKSPNLIQHRSACIKKQIISQEIYRSIIIRMEYVESNLLEYIQERKRQNRKFGAEEVKQMIFQMLAVLELLQKSKVAHRDIKPQNIMVKELGEGEVIYKLCDFGDSIIVNEKSIEDLPITTFEYTSYSMLKCLQKNQRRVFDPYKIDTFALGLTALKMCSMGRFIERERISQLENKETHQKFLKDARYKYIKPYKDDEMNYLIKLMVEVDEFRRDDASTMVIRVEEYYQQELEKKDGSFWRRRKEGTQQMFRDERQKRFFAWTLCVQTLAFIIFCIFF